MHTALTGAVGGLDQAERSQAIAAVTHGVVPADQKVRSAALRLGWAYLGGKSADQLKRQERRNWIASAVLVAAGIALAIMDSEQRLYFLVLVLFLLVVLPLGCYALDGFNAMSHCLAKTRFPGRATAIGLIADTARPLARRAATRSPRGISSGIGIGSWGLSPGGGAS